ncbi:MAG TPA: DUF1549 and DUF1553 domain-containing protein [Gemmataceae bacterium]|nr:DUF1549 and DUF1553 domain-containing protein [Gemmataceae bacterium]
MRCWLFLIPAVLAFYTPVHSETPELVTEKPIQPADRAHWAFQLPTRPSAPTVKQESWIQTPVDRFILSKLEAAGLSPAPPADRRTLLRRVYFDLVGLPPTPEELDAFLADSSPDAYEKIVDRLLTSPHYGERWAQHWLDCIRYAESNGYEADSDRPHAWRYRDYVARSFNADKPYNQFLTEQLAGDELAAGKDARAAADLWVASGMHRCGPVHMTSGNLDQEVTRQEVLTEYVQGVGAAVLGLTMNCARCHDHKFDPVSQADYYRLEAFFAAARFKEVGIGTSEEEAAFQKQVKALEEQLKPMKAEVAAIDKPHIDRLQAAKKAKLEPMYVQALDTDAKKRTPEQKKLAEEAATLIKVTWDEIYAVLTPDERARRQSLRERIHALEATRPAGAPTAWAIRNDDRPPPTYILKRGEVKRKAGTVEPEYPRVISGAGAQRSAVREPTRALLAFSGTPWSVVAAADGRIPARLSRVDLANWITRPDHPLTTRVFVNRVWQHHFGRGIVGTPNDFGRRGEKPTHPELLDYLATELVANGWHLKPIHRMIVLSNTYRQASKVTPSAQAMKSDPDNRLLWRISRRRLDGEALRDATLAAAGTLNRQVGGPSVRVPLEPEVYDLIFTEGEPDGLWHVTPDPSQHTRRSLYLLAKRNVRLPMLEAFDQPDRLTPCADRAVSMFAPQALILMNGPFTHDQSRAMAATVIRESGQDVERQVARAYARAFGRPPSAAEMKVAKDFLRDQAESAADRLRARLPAGVPEGLPAGADVPHAVALADFCLALCNANEFVYGP